MNLRLPLILAGSLLLSVGLSANVTVYSEDFSSATALKDFQFQLGGNTRAANTRFITLGQWGGAASAGVNEPALGSGTGASTGNDISSIGLGRPMDFRSANNRAIVTILPASLFTSGTMYQVSFDVIGDPAPATGYAARYFLDLVYGYDLGDGAGSATTDAAILIDNTPGALGDLAVGVGLGIFTAKNGATVIPTAEGAILGVDVAATTPNAFTFTYNGANSPDVALAFNAYNTFYGIDNLKITVVPEPSTAVLALGALGVFGVWRLRRRS